MSSKHTNMYTPTILIVSDAKNLRTSIANVLEFAGYRVDTTKIAAAKDLLKYKLFDLLFLDLRMPHKEGMKLLYLVRVTHSSMHTIVISSTDNIDFRTKVMRNGAKDFLLKPVEPGQIVQTCDSLLTTIF